MNEGVRRAMQWALAMGGVLALVSSAAHASSFVAIAPPKEALGPSFVAPRPSTSSFAVLGAPAAIAVATVRPRSPLDAPPDFDGGATVVVSPSVIAMGRPAVVLAEAARPAPRARPAPLPVVIRGGAVESARAVPAVATIQASPAPPQSTPVKSPKAVPDPPAEQDRDEAPPPRSPGPAPAMPVLARPE